MAEIPQAIYDVLAQAASADIWRADYTKRGVEIPIPQYSAIDRIAAATGVTLSHHEWRGVVRALRLEPEPVRSRVYPTEIKEKWKNFEREKKRIVEKIEVADPDALVFSL